MSEVMPVWRFRRAVWLATGLVGFAAACAEPSGLDISILVMPSVDTLVLGSSTVFDAQVMGDALASGASIQWRTSDSTVATIRADGRTHALAPGTASITASMAGVMSSPATLVVIAPNPAIELTPTRVRVRVGSVVLFTATVLEEVDESPPGMSYTWTTSDPHVAVVFQVPSFPYGLAVALRPGVAEIEVAAAGAVSSPSVLEVVGTAASSQ